MTVAPEPVGKPSAGTYFLATRAYSFPASIVSVLLGTALAFRGYGGAAHFDGVALMLTLIGAVLAHAAGNVFNDYFDFAKGVDTRPEHGSGVLTQGLLTLPQMWRFGVALLAAAALCGLLLLWRSPQLLSAIVPLALLGAACAILYTWFLKQIALGDLTIMTAFGLGLTLGAYAVQTPVTNNAQVTRILLLALPLTLLVDAILHANNIRDAENDASRGYRTIASLLGPNAAWGLHAILIFGPVALVAAFVALHLLPLSALAVLLALPLLWKAYKSGDVPFTAQAHLIFGVLYALGVSVGY